MIMHHKEIVSYFTISTLKNVFLIKLSILSQKNIFFAFYIAEIINPQPTSSNIEDNTSFDSHKIEPKHQRDRSKRNAKSKGNYTRKKKKFG